MLISMAIPVNGFVLKKFHSIKCLKTIVYGIRWCLRKNLKLLVHLRSVLGVIKHWNHIISTQCPNCNKILILKKNIFFLFFSMSSVIYSVFNIKQIKYHFCLLTYHSQYIICVFSDKPSHFDKFHNFWVCSLSTVASLKMFWNLLRSLPFKIFSSVLSSPQK